MAIVCCLLVTLLPLPLFSVPFFRFSIAILTAVCDALLYLAMGLPFFEG